MNEPREQPTDPRIPHGGPIWSQWRARRAARTPGTPPPGEPPSGPEPEEPATPPADEGRPEPPAGDERSEQAPEPGSEPSAGDPGPDALRGLAAGPDGLECVEWCPICRTADVLRATVPPELREQWHEVQREALTTLRAALDHYISRLEQQPRGASRVEDIPID